MPTAGASSLHSLIESHPLHSFGRFVYIQGIPFWSSSKPFTATIVTGDPLHPAITRTFTFFVPTSIIITIFGKFQIAAVLSLFLSLSFSLSLFLSLSLSLPPPPLSPSLSPGSCLMSKLAVSTTTMSEVTPCQLGRS